MMNLLEVVFVLVFWLVLSAVVGMVELWFFKKVWRFVKTRWENRPGRAEIKLKIQQAELILEAERQRRERLHNTVTAQRVYREGEAHHAR